MYIWVFKFTHKFRWAIFRYNPILEAVITLTEELAYRQAEDADKLLAQGVYLGKAYFCYPISHSL